MDPKDASRPAKPPRRALKDIKIESGRSTGRVARAISYGRISFGGVLGRTFTIYGKGFLPIVLMSLLVYSPLIAYTVWTFRAQASAAPAPASVDDSGFEDEAAFSRPSAGPERTWNTIYTWGGLLLSAFLAGPVTYLVVSRLRGRSPGLGDSLRVGLGRIPRILLTALLLGVFWVGAVIAGVLVMIPLGLLVSVLGKVLGVIVLGVAFGLGLLWFLSMFWVAIPAAVVEEGGPSDAIGRSVRLTKRNVWKIIAINAVLLVGGFALHTAMGTVGRGDLDSLRLFALGQVLLTAVVTGPLGAVAAAVGYHDLRTSAEGIGTEEIARVFE